MIDIKELRIGNYYNQFGNIYQVNGHIISELEKAPQGQLWCKPIPLTEEWLLKFGFEKDDVFDEFFTYLPIHDLCMDKLSFRVDEGFICYESIKYRTLLKHIQYVHSLQNLYFALTNQELEIKK
jgi:hypothetical protein